MGYRGKLAEREKARHLRAEGATLAEIATTLGVAKSSASLWVRDVAVPGPARRTGPRRRSPMPFSAGRRRRSRRAFGGAARWWERCPAATC
jgi:hypothetical protein